MLESRIISAVPTQNFNVRSHFWMKYMHHYLYVVKYSSDYILAPTYSLNLIAKLTQLTLCSFMGSSPRGCSVEWTGRSTGHTKWSCSLWFHQFSVTQDGSPGAAANPLLPASGQMEGLHHKFKSGTWWNPLTFFSPF